MWFLEIVNLINTYSSAIIAVLTIMLVIATIYYAAITQSMLRESKTARAALSIPNVVAYTRPHAKHISSIEVCFHNLGPGDAYGVKVSFQIDPEKLEKYNLQHLPTVPTQLTNVMPVGSIICTHFGTYYELVEKEGDIGDFGISIEYLDIRGKSYVFSEKFSAKIHSWLSVLGHSNVDEIAENTGKIANHLRELVQKR